MSFAFSYNRVRDSGIVPRKVRWGVTLLEIIIVLFIISILLCLLVPAIQAAWHAVENLIQMLA